MKNTRPRVEIDHNLFQAKVDGKPVYLSQLEFEILDLLMENRGKVCSRRFIDEKLNRVAYTTCRTIDVYIGYLRKKLGFEIIKTRRQFGYYIEK
jgi:two-component system, OmpR family, response regulator